MQNKNDSGVVYLAFGVPYLAMALVSFESLRKTNPDIPVCIITNVCQGLNCINGWNYSKDRWWYIEENTLENRNIKTKIIDYTPFEKTLYLDCDTIVISNISLCWVFLDYFDICIKSKNDPQLGFGKGDILVLEKRYMISELPHWNSGVFLFKKNYRVNNFFDLWYKYYCDIKSPYDQVSLVEAIFRSDCRILSLDDRWNKQSGDKRLRSDLAIKIIHYTSDIDHEIRKKIYCASRIINSSSHYSVNGSIKEFLNKRRRHRIKKEGYVRYYYKYIKRLLY